MAGVSEQCTRWEEQFPDFCYCLDCQLNLLWVAGYLYKEDIEEVKVLWKRKWRHHEELLLFRQGKGIRKPLWLQFFLYKAQTEIEREEFYLDHVEDLRFRQWGLAMLKNVLPTLQKTEGVDAATTLLDILNIFMLDPADDPALISCVKFEFKKKYKSMHERLLDLSHWLDSGLGENDSIIIKKIRDLFPLQYQWRNRQRPSST